MGHPVGSSAPLGGELSSRGQGSLCRGSKGERLGAKTKKRVKKLLWDISPRSFSDQLKTQATGEEHLTRAGQWGAIEQQQKLMCMG